MKLKLNRFAITASNSATLKSSGGNKATLRVTFTENSTSTANNTSSITATAGIKMNTGSYSGISSPYLYVYWHSNVNNTDYELGRLNITALSSTEKTVSGTKSDVAHAADGTASGYAWAQWSYSGSSGYVPKSGTIATSSTNLTTIPRASSIEATEANIGSTSTITIDKASNSFTHTLTYSFTGNGITRTGTIATKTSSPSVSFTLPGINDANNLYPLIPNDMSITGNITCTTYSDNTVVGTSNCSITANVPTTAKPTIRALTLTGNNPEIVDTDTISRDTIKLFVQNKSKLSFDFSNAFSTNYSSPANVYLLKINGTQVKNDSTTTYTMSTALPNTTNTYELIVYDTRGNYNTTGEQTLTAYSYTEPRITLFTAERNSTTPTIVNIKYSAVITNINNNNKNSKLFTIEYRQVGSTTWSTITTANDAYTKSNVSVNKTNVNDSHTFEFRLTATDSYGSSTYPVQVGTSATLINFGADGTAIAFGKASESSNSFECALNANFTGDVKKNGTDILQPAYNQIGTLNNLNTSVKTNLVNAINVLAPGEIIDSKLNEASGYIKYSNGFMIQWKFGSGTGGGQAWTSPIYYSDISMGNWDVPFTTIFNYIPSVASSLYWCTSGDFNNTSAGTIRVFRPNNGTTTVYVRAFAYGKWK